MIRTQEQWINEYKKKDALWIHDGNPKSPHALLTSGMHSNGFFNSRIVISDVYLLREAAIDLVHLFRQQRGNILNVDIVVGPQTGATKLAEFISGQVAYSRGKSCNWASPAKFETNGAKEMVFDNPNVIRAYHDALLCEDVLTTGGSVELTEKAIEKCGGNVLPFVLVLVNRSGLKFAGDKKIVALIDQPMPIWDPSECELCLVGSEPIRPKDNWVRLTASA